MNPARGQKVKLPFLTRKIKTTQKIFLTQQLRIMTKAAIPLTTALKTIQSQTVSKRLKIILTEVTGKVEQGQTFSQALRPFENDFGELMINMIAAGEASGRLEEVFGQIHLQLKKDYEIISRVRGALMYPAVVVVAMVGIGAGMIVFVIPKLTEIFKETNIELPLPTRILIAISDFIVNHGLIVAAGLITAISLFIWTIHRPKGKYVWHWILLKSPIIGPIIQNINLARFSRTVSSFLKTDIPIVKTLSTTSRVLGNVHYQNALMSASERVVKGITLKESLDIYPKLFNPTIIQMIAVGEQSGSLDDILAEAAEFYENEVAQTMTTLPSLLEPILMVVLGLGVGGMAVAIMLPLYTLAQAF